MNIQQIMQQAQVMQKRMLELQDQLGNEEITGDAGGGLVKVTMTCRKSVRGIKIDPSVIDPADPEMLEDLITAACNDAETKADDRLSSETERMMAELGLPANFQLPM
jgi:DNA-binding YbaB/EbfC family protein